MPDAKRNPSPQPSDAADRLTLAGLDDEALGLLYDQVRAIAGKFRRSGFHHDSLSTTALSNETLLKVFSKLIDKPFDSQQHLVNTIAKVLLQAFTGRGVSASGHATMPEFLGNAGEGLPPLARHPSEEPPRFGGVHCPPEPQATQRARAARGLRSITRRTSSVVSGSCS